MGEQQPTRRGGQKLVGSPDQFAELEPNVPTEAEARVLRHYIVSLYAEPVALRPWRVTLFGRDEGCKVRVDSDTVSRRHASVRSSDDEGWVIEDLGSANGTWLNGHRIDQSLLIDGDFFTLGNASFGFIATTRRELAVRVDEVLMRIHDLGAKPNES